jgi:hypothetical protein
MWEMNNQESKYPITALINSVYFSLDYTLIVKEGNGFRLLVIHNNKKLVDKIYTTLKGARIAFHRAFKKFGYKADIETDWTKFYNPDTMWLEELSNCPENSFNYNFKLSKKKKTKKRQATRTRYTRTLVRVKI